LSQLPAVPRSPSPSSKTSPPTNSPCTPLEPPPYSSVVVVNLCSYSLPTFPRFLRSNRPPAPPQPPPLHLPLFLALSNSPWPNALPSGLARATAPSLTARGLSRPRVHSTLLSLSRERSGTSWSSYGRRSGAERGTGRERGDYDIAGEGKRCRFGGGVESG
jgi:hypothetical protein